MMWLSDEWKDYEILDTADGEKLERWGNFTCIRPDPQVIWSYRNAKEKWHRVSGKYIRSKKGGGNWEIYDEKCLRAGK